MKIVLSEGADAIQRQEWNQITGLQYPFTRHEFINALEQSACVRETTGWQPQHCLVYQQDELIALMPLYRKTHSYGEYVFDFAWANAHHQYGIPYYPKWVTAIPFTPCEGRRLCIKSGVDEAAVAKAIVNFIIDNAELHQVSTWHCLYLLPLELRLYKSFDLIIREGTQFRWRNKGYRDFQDYLSTFTSKRRKTILRERRFVADQGIVFQQIQGKDISEEQLEVFFQFYQLTYLKRANEAYLNLHFFREIVAMMPESILLILALKGKIYVGAAFNLIGADSLYGRYWGCYHEYHSLHFETCYYQGLEYCIDNDLQLFDAGAQGEHKIARGFEPESTYSVHSIHNAELSDAIEQFTRHEANALSHYRNDVATLLPFKK